MDTETSYDRVADEYVQRIFNELDHKPFDRQVLEEFASRVRDMGLCCDMGCGPGQIARYLHELGVNVMGVDLSLEMVIRARRLTPAITFEQGNMLALNVPDAAWAGIAAFYSLIHITRDDMQRALGELKRALQRGGTLLLSFHIGDGALHLDEWWGHTVCVDFHFFQTAEMMTFLKQAGFDIEKSIEREPYPDVEHQSRRAYIFARKPD